MKKNIRISTFETNSSSIHSIVISSEGLEPSNLPMDNDGNILVEYGTFDKEGDFNSQIDKLSYLITQCYYLGGFGGWDDCLDPDVNYHFDHVREAILDYVKDAHDIKVIGGEPDIDHQSIPDYELNLVNEWDKTSIQDFVFNKFVTLHCDID